MGRSVHSPADRKIADQKNLIFDIVGIFLIPFRKRFIMMSGELRVALFPDRLILQIFSTMIFLSAVYIYSTVFKDTSLFWKHFIIFV